MQSFWQTLPKAFLVLAPMDDVTDTVFRRIVAACARPDIFFTEFASADGFCSAGREAVEKKLRFTPEEKPIVVQLWGKNPDKMYETVKILAGRGFDGIDINMGCPERAVMKHGSGAALINAPEIAKALISAVKIAVKDAGVDLPVSVKTRIGFTDIITEKWIPFLLEQGIDALTIHGRTAEEMSKVPCHWDQIGKAVEIRDSMRLKTAIIGNGDVADARDAHARSTKFGVDGVMIGRGIFHNPWAFAKPPQTHTSEELLRLAEKHITMFETEWGNTKHFATLKKFFKMYIKGFDGAAELRDRLMQANTVNEALLILGEFRGKPGKQQRSQVIQAGKPEVAI